MDPLPIDADAILSPDRKELTDEKVLLPGCNVLVPNLLAGGYYEGTVKVDSYGMLFIETKDWLISPAFRRGRWIVFGMGNRKCVSKIELYIKA